MGSCEPLVVNYFFFAQVNNSIQIYRGCRKVIRLISSYRIIYNIRSPVCVGLSCKQPNKNLLFKKLHGHHRHQFKLDPDLKPLIREGHPGNTRSLPLMFRRCEGERKKWESRPWEEDSLKELASCISDSGRSGVCWSVGGSPGATWNLLAFVDRVPRRKRYGRVSFFFLSFLMYPVCELAMCPPVERSIQLWTLP